MPDEKEDNKPKKLFEVKFTVWDDAEIDGELYEYRKTNSGRGAPGKWRMNGKDFKRRVEETIGDHADILTTFGEIAGKDISGIYKSENPSAEKVEKPKNKESKAGGDPEIEDLDFDDK
jgi:hypothetical protein